MATIASLLRDRVSLQVRSVDRIFLQGYLPKLQSEGQVVRFLLDRGFPIPSPAALGKISQSYVRAIQRFASKHEVPVVHFKKGESKEQTARRYMQKAEREGRFGVVMIGVCQERAPLGVATAKAALTPTRISAITATSTCADVAACSSSSASRSAMSAHHCGPRSQLARSSGTARHSW
ncbi:MAG: hypothetical protein ACRDL5_06080 [Solirubrobacteraceae bacterium]